MKKYLITILLIPSLYVNLLSADVNIGDRAPNIILRDTDNKLIITRNILQDKPILIGFFFTACAPCKKEIPELERLNKQYGKKIKMFLIAIDKEGTDIVKPYAESMNITIKLLIDKYSDVAKLYNIKKYPTTFIIGTDEKIKYYCAGYNKANISKIERIIKKLK